MLLYHHPNIRIMHENKKLRITSAGTVLVQIINLPVELLFSHYQSFIFFIAVSRLNSGYYG